MQQNSGTHPDGNLTGLNTNCSMTAVSTHLNTLEDIEVEAKGGNRDDNSGKRKVQEGDNDSYNAAIEIPAKRFRCPSMTSSKHRFSNFFSREHRHRLFHLFEKLTRDHNWPEASGVLSVLLKGTRLERSFVKNQKKYWAAMEIISRISNTHIILPKIRRIHDAWMDNYPLKSSCSKEKRNRIELEFALFHLRKGNIDEAHTIIDRLMQEDGSNVDPVVRTMFGLTLYQLWYGDVPEEMQLTNDETRNPLEAPEIDSNSGFKNSESSNSVNIQDAEFYTSCDSNSSIGNDKGPTQRPNKGKALMDSDGEQPKKQSRQIDMEEPAVKSEQEVPSISYDNLKDASILRAYGLDTSLLPIRLPHLKETWKKFCSLREVTVDEGYGNAENREKAMEQLNTALESTPPVLAALFPFIQLLLLGDKINEALKKLKNFYLNSNTVVSFRLRASLLECFSSKCSTELSTCYEDILNMDPTYNHSLAGLISMHTNGNYRTEQLLEMIALHLDATYASSCIWEELASCLLRLQTMLQSQFEEDRMSMDQHTNDTGFNQPCFISCSTFPRAFLNGESRKSWKLRCRWWRTRHFSKNTFLSESQAGLFIFHLEFRTLSSHSELEGFFFLVNGSSL